MNGILVDTENRNLKEIDEVNIDEIDDLIGCESYLLPIKLNNDSDVYCEVDALFKPQKGGAFIKDFDFPILGKFLVLNCEVECLNSQISWLNETLAEVWRRKF